jgi:hypothetical protein
LPSVVEAFACISIVAAQKRTPDTTCYTVIVRRIHK